MANVTFLMLPEFGHILPTLPLASSLMRSNHHVCYLTVPDFGSLFRQLGIECRFVATDASDVEQPDAWSVRRSGRVIIEDLSKQLSGIGGSPKERMVRHLIEAGTDLVACDVKLLDHWGEFFARQLRPPIVAINVTLTNPMTSQFPEIVLCPVEFELPAARRCLSNRYFCEPSVWRHRAISDDEWVVKDHRRLVYCSLGTQAFNYTGASRVLRDVIEAFEGLPAYRLIMAATSLYETIATGALPSNITVVRSAPQLKILRHADIVITNGGLGTLKEAILERVPALVIPFLYDQPANGQRVEYHGIGRTCRPADCSPDKIRRAVMEISDDSALRARLAELSERFWAREREPIAGRLLERVLSGLPLEVSEAANASASTPGDNV